LLTFAANILAAADFFPKGASILKDKLRVAAYCRVSTDKEDQANSLTSQINYFTKYINAKDGWEICEVYYDEGISGTSIEKRAGFNRMINDAQAHKMDLIMTKEVSRFARNTVDTLSYTRRLKELGVGVFFMNDNIDTRDADGELRLTIMASIAQEESRKTSERVKWGQKRRMEQGIVFGRDMLGYTVYKGRLILNPDEANTVKLIYNKFLIEGKGTHIIARELSEAGIYPKRVKEWSNTVILKILRNEKYVGDLCQKKTYTPDFLSHSKKYNRGHEELIYLHDHHDPIIDREIWNKTQVELERRSPSSERNSKYSNRYWCSGKLICGECGRRFVSRTKKLKNGEVYKAWRCYALAAHGRKKKDRWGNEIGCNSGSVNDKVLLACVTEVLKGIQSKKDTIISEIIQEIRAVQEMDSKVDTAPLYAKIGDIDDKKRRAIDLTLDGTISREELKQQNIFYDTEIEKLTVQIAQAENMNSTRRQSIQSIEEYISEISRMLEFDTEDTLLYREVVERIVISNGNLVTVYLNCVPFGVKLHYQTTGRMENFSVSFDEMDISD